MVSKEDSLPMYIMLEYELSIGARVPIDCTLLITGLLQSEVVQQHISIFPDSVDT